MAKADVRAIASAPSALEDRPTILAVGRGEAMLEAIALALDRHGVQIEIGDPDNAVQAVFVHAPDMVLLVGDAAADEGRATLEKLAATVATAVIPVAILSDDAGLDQRMQAARLGAVAVVPRSASADQMAQRIAEVARELPERKSEGGTDLGEATLDEVVELFARRLRSGVLAVSASGGSERVVLRGDRPVTQAIEELVDRLRPLVTQSETVRWEFQQASTGKLAELKLDDEPSGTLDVAALFRDRRLVIVERSPARADDLVVALRQRGAHVVVIDGEGTGLAKARAIDPDVILVDVSGVGGWAGQAMQQIRADARLRWAALLVTRGEELWKANTPEPDIARLAAGMLPLVEPDESLTQRIRDGKASIDVRLETTGPTRMLRAIARAGQTVHVTVRHRRASVEIDFAQGLVVGARGEAQSETPGGKPTKVEGAAALALCAGLATARVRIERRDAPSVANVMSPVDDAIAAADREPSPIAPSIPPPAGPASLHPSTAGSSGSMRPPSGETDARVLVHQLENLLDRLRHTLPPGSLEVPSEVSAALAARANADRKDATPSVAVKPDEPVIPAPARVPGAPTKPQPRKVTQMGVPVPPGLLRAVPPPGSATKKTAAPPPVDPAQIPVAPPGAIVPPPSAFVAPPVKAEPTRPPSMALAKTQPAVLALPPPTVAKGRPDAEEPATGRIVPLADMLEPPSDAEAAANVDALLSSELESLPASEPPAPVVALTPDLPPPSLDASRPPLEATDQIALPPSGEPEDDDVVLPKRGRGAVWLVAGAALVAVVGLGAAVAWRMGLFGTAAVVATPLGGGPEPTSTLPIAPPSTVAEAPPTSVAALPPTTVAEAPPTSVAEVPPSTVPPTTVAEVPPTSVAALPPTTVAEVAPPPTTVVEAPPPTVAEVTPPPSTVDESTDEEEDDGHEHEALSPTDPQYFVNRGNFRRMHGDLQGAEADYLHVLRMSPNNARAMAGLARVHLARHDARTAATWARRLAEGHNPNPGNYVLLGDTLQASGDAAGARRAWERALQIAPGYRDARRRLGR